MKKHKIIKVIHFPEELYRALNNLSIEENRTFSNQLLYILSLVLQARERNDEKR
jgi:hypothetical protein